MLRKIGQETMGTSNLGWLNSWFHFSFAEYYHPDRMHFGVLRVVNDDLIQPGTGFDRHSHQDMEIITYVVNGVLTHEDSMGNQRTLKRGEVQYMSAGSGIAHSEHNRGETLLRLLQIWIFPDKKDYEPRYGDHRFPWEARVNQWLHLVSGIQDAAPVSIHQEADLFVSEIKEGNSLIFDVVPGHQGYLIQIEGTSLVNDTETLEERDALEVKGESIRIYANTDSHVLMFDMKASD